MARRIRVRSRPRRVPRRIGMFLPARHRYLSEIITFRSITGAREAARQLRRLYHEAKTRQKKLTILRAVVLAANRAEVAAKRHPSFSPEVRRKWKRIAQIYRDLAEDLKTAYMWRYHRTFNEEPKARQVLADIPKSIADWNYTFSFVGGDKQHMYPICIHPTKPIIAIYNEGEGVLYVTYKNEDEAVEALGILRAISDEDEFGKDCLSELGLKKVPAAPSLNWFKKALQKLTLPESMKIERVE